MRAFVIVAGLLCASSAALAEWKTGSFVDRMTDRKETFAELQAKEGAATLYVGCMNGHISPDITFPERIAYGEVGVTYRFDEGQVVPRIARLPSDGKALWLWISSGPETALRIRRSKRLRVQLKEAFFDFDLTGAETAIKPIVCR